MYNNVKESMTALLCALLSCNPEDLKILQNVRNIRHDWYEWDEIVYWTSNPEEKEEKIDFNSLMQTIVGVSNADLWSEINMQIDILKCKSEVQELNNDEKTKLGALQTLDPRRDICGDFDYSNTHIKFVRNSSIYRKYLSDAINDFENNVGMKIADGEEIPEDK